MKNYPQKNFGFTLIELLIVIALLGALAVGMIATINPFEQLKKGQDTAKRNIVSELYNAFIRYYGLRNEFPWGTSVFASAITLDTASAYITSVMETGELKDTFMEAADSYKTKIFISSPDDQSLNVCFIPESKAFQVDKLTKYNMHGEVQIDSCSSQVTSGGSACAWCVK